MKNLPQLLRKSGTTLAQLALLAAGGALLYPLARDLSQTQQKRGLRLPAPTISREDAIGQQIAFFSLGGLRSLAAEILALDATDAWLKSDWNRAQRRWETITTLSPHRINYWIRASQDLARNAVSQVRTDDRFTRHDQAILANQYAQKGLKFLTDGIANNPTSARLYLELARYYAEVPLPAEYTKAAHCYQRALELGAPPMFRRWVLYNLSKSRTHIQEAWQLARELYNDEANRTPSMLGILFALQNKANVAPELRLTPEQLFGTRQKAVQNLRTYITNDLHYPTYGVQEWLNQNQATPPPAAPWTKEQ